MLARLGAAIARRPWRALALALLVSALAGGLGMRTADVLEPYNGDPDPESESALAAERIRAATGFDPRGAVIALVEPGAPVTSPRGRAAIARVARDLARDPNVARAIDPLAAGVDAAVARDGRAAYVLAFLRPDSALEQRDAAEELIDRYDAHPHVELGGVGIGYVEGTETSAEDFARAERIALPLLLVAALVVFRGLVAALLPVAVGMLSIAWSLGLLRVLAEALPVSVFALNLVTALALALAIDFSLLLVSRQREELARGRAPADALRVTLATAGRTVLVSGATIAAAMCALLVFPQRLLYSLGLAGLLASLLTALLAVVVVAALLALLGERVNALAPRRLRRRAEREASDPTAGGWYRLARWVSRRPAATALAASAVLLALAAPALGLSVTSADTPRELPPGTSARTVDDTLAERFPAHRTTPVRAVVEAPPGPAVERYAERLAALPNAVAAVPVRLSADRTEVQVVSAAPPFADASLELVEDVRAVPAPAPVAVGGDSASFVDQKDSVAGHAGPAIAVAALATLLVLFLVTGAVVVAVKTVLMNALTVAATLGVLVLAFQHGLLEGPLGFESRGALVDVGVVVYVAALAFGISTDYAVMLLARIREGIRGGRDNTEATALGLERTGRIVTAAAVLFSIAIAGSATSQIIAVKEAAVGIVVAVIVDATLVRSLLVPALMTLLGDWNWWAPRWLRALRARLAPAS